MSSDPPFLQRVLRGLLLRLYLWLGGLLRGREGWLRARLARMPEGHRHRRAVARELARLEALRAQLADPAVWADVRQRGAILHALAKAFEPGRRGWVWRTFAISRRVVMPGARPAPVAELEAPEGRCTIALSPLVNRREAAIPLAYLA